MMGGPVFSERPVMASQQEFPLAWVQGRKYDMPPFWDGMPVEWNPWDEDHLTFLCGSKKCVDAAWQTCEHCGYQGHFLTSRGVVRTRPEQVPSISLGNLQPQHFVDTLHATRCPRCGVTHVIDRLGSTDPQEWILDKSDYSPGGSWETQS